MVKIIKSDPGKYHCAPEKVIHEIENYNQNDIFKRIAYESKELLDSNDIEVKTISIISLNRLSNLILMTNCNGDKIINNKEFIQLNQMVNSLEEHSFKLKEEKCNDLKYLLDDYLLKTAYNQLVNSNKYMNLKISNNCYMYKNKFKDNNGKDLSWYFEKCYGFNFEIYIFISYLLFTLSLKNSGIININTICAKLSKDEIVILKKIIHLHSKDLASAKIMFKKEDKYNKTDDYIFTFNFFRDYPILKINDFEYIIPFIGFYIKTMSDLIYYKILDHFASIEKDTNVKNHNPYDNCFSQFYGICLEKLIYEYIKITKPKTRLEPEFEFSGNKSADMQILEGKNLLLIQLKNKRAILDSQAGNFDKYKNDVKKALIKPYLQNIKLLLNNDFMIEIKKRLKIKKKIKKVFSIIITPQNFYVNHIEIIENYIDSEIKKINCENRLPFKVFLFFTSIEGFEKLIELSNIEKNSSIVSFIKKYLGYLENPKHLNNKGDGKIVFNFEDYKFNFINGYFEGQFTDKYFKNDLFMKISAMFQ